jgi:hypothetical protein
VVAHLSARVRLRRLQRQRDQVRRQSRVRECLPDEIDWQVDLNNVDPSDGRTVLDYIGDERDAASQGSATRGRLDRYYNLLRRDGELHREELGTR